MRRAGRLATMRVIADIDWGERPALATEDDPVADPGSPAFVRRRNGAAAGQARQRRA